MTVGSVNLVQLDHDGMGEMLKSKPVADVIGGIADSIGDAVTGEVEGAEVVVDKYTTDRAAASVTIKDARALAWQVRDGILSRPAAREGLEVNER